MSLTARFHGLSSPSHGLQKPGRLPARLQLRGGTVQALRERHVDSERWRGSEAGSAAASRCEDRRRWEKEEAQCKGRPGTRGMVRVTRRRKAESLRAKVVRPALGPRRSMTILAGCRCKELARRTRRLVQTATHHPSKASERTTPLRLRTARIDESSPADADDEQSLQAKHLQTSQAIPSPPSSGTSYQARLRIQSPRFQFVQSRPSRPKSPRA